MKKWYSNSTLRKICDGQKLKSILPDMKRLDPKDATFKDNIKLSMQQKRGRLIEVYDGRSWPVVKSGNVYVSPDDSVENVKSSILSASGPQGKKSSKKNSKHALAIGTSFGHVHAFLKDSDQLLQEIERNQAQDKCLMLIKKPKSSSKQMLKAQSWANLSVSDSHLYQQLDGGYHTDHRRHKYRTKRKSDVQQMSPETVSSLKLTNGEQVNSDLMSENWRQHKDNGTRKLRNDERSRRSEVRSEVKDQYSYPIEGQRHGYVKNEKNWNMNPSSSNCLSEINNNKKLTNGNRMYSSHNDIYRQFPKTLGYKPVNDSGAIKSDEFYSKNICDIQEESTFDQDPVSRSHSVGDLTTGLTLSLVGQRKSESVQCLSAAHAPPKPPRLAQTQNENYSPILQNQNTGAIGTNRKISQQNSDVRNQNMLSNPGRLAVNAKSRTPRSGMKSNSNLNVVSENKVLKVDDSLSELSTKSEQGPPKTPSKQRRTLPCIPYGDLNEKKRQYAEIVKMRMSAQSRSSVSSSRQSAFTPQSADLSKSGRIDENLSDREVSDLLGSQMNGNYASVHEHNSSGTSNKNGYPSSDQDNEITRISSENMNSHGNVHTSLPSSVRSCDSGHTTLTSLSSTVDSGYLTNDQDVDMYSSSSYMRSLQKSAQNLYHNNKLQVYSYGNGSRRDSSSEKSVHSATNPRRDSTSENYRNHSKRAERNSGNYEEIQSQYSKQVSVSKGNSSNTLPRQTSASKMPQNPSVQNFAAPVSGKNSNTVGATSVTSGKKPVVSGFRRISDLELTANWDHANSVKPNFYSGQGQSNYVEEVTDFTSRKSKNLQHYDYNPNQHIAKNNPSTDSHLIDNKPCSKLASPTKQYPKMTSPTKQYPKITSPSKQYPKLPSPDDSQISEELQYSTLPGNWRYHGNKNDDDSSVTKKHPCLFQILQSHELLPIRINLDENCLFIDNVKLRESQISLPSLKKNAKKETPVVSTPKGKYAHLGGPGSAFKPVKAATNANYSLVTMVIVDEILPTNSKLCETGNLLNGDILVEVNERMVMGDPLGVINELLQNLPGEIALTVARLKPQTTQNSQVNDNHQSLNMEEMKKTLEMMQAEMKAKDQKILELNSLLPWKQNVEEVVRKIEINGNCYPSELLPNGLGEDEYIV